jgi:hypothetical protein
VARGLFPAAELAAVRLGALFSCHLDRFRSDIRQSRYRSSAVVFTAADAHAFADALARDIACAAPMLDAASASGAARLAGRLAANAEHDDPRSDDIATDARDLAVALSGFRRGALELALRALPVDADGGVELAEALRPSVHGADRMTGELQSSNRARSGAGPGSAGDHRADPGLDLVVHAAFSSDLVHGIDAVQDALSDAVAADLRSAGLGGVPLEGVHWSEATRWPDGWEERIRHGSVLTAPGRCTVLPGR